MRALYILLVFPCLWAWMWFRYWWTNRRLDREAWEHCAAILRGEVER